MITSMAPMPSSSSSSSATVRVEKATSEFLTGPDWTLNIDICDTINSNQMLAKDVVKAVKKRLQHKNPKVQLLALTLLETMVKNCGDYVHFLIAERNILQEMVKIVRKKTDMHVRDKVLTLIGSWCDAFGGSRGKYPQYYLAYEDLRRSGVQFPRRPPDAAPIFTPPVTQPQPGYGMPSSSSTRLDEAMAAEDNLSLSSLKAMRTVLDLLADMLRAVDPNDRSAIKDEIIVDLVEQCRVNQRKLIQLLGTTGDEELLCQGLELNDSLQTVLAKHDAIASGSPLPAEVTTPTNKASEKQYSGLGRAEEIINKPSPTSNGTPSAPPKPSPTSNGTTSASPVLPAQKNLIDEEDEEEDDFAQLARRHSKTRTDVSDNTSMVPSDSVPSEAPEDPTMSKALVPVDQPATVRSQDQDIIDLLSITLSTTGTSTEQTSQTFTPGPVSSSSPGTTFSSPVNNGMSFNNYIAPWAQPQPQQYSQPQTLYTPQQYSQPQPSYAPQPQHYTQPQVQSQPEARTQAQLHPQPQFPQYTAAASSYPPPPWAATPGYYSNQNPVSRPTYTYSTARPTSSSNSVAINGEALLSPRSSVANVGPKPFIPSYRLFEDLDVFGNVDGRFKATNNGSPSLAGANNQNMVGGRK